MDESKRIEPINYHFVTSVNMDVKIEKPAASKSVILLLC